MGRRVYTGTYQLTEEVRDSTVGNIGDERIEEERPCHRVQKCLLDLIHLKMLVTNTLLINLHSGHSQDSVLFAEPPGIQLAVGDNPKEDAA